MSIVINPKDPLNLAAFTSAGPRSDPSAQRTMFAAAATIPPTANEAADSLPGSRIQRPVLVAALEADAGGSRGRLENGSAVDPTNHES